MAHREGNSQAMACPCGREVELTVMYVSGAGILLAPTQLS